MDKLRGHFPALYSGNTKKRQIWLWLVIIFILALFLSIGVSHLEKQAIRVDEIKLLDMRDAYRQEPIDFFKDISFRRGYDTYLPFTNSALKDIKAFPVPIEYRERIGYEDSFGTARTYGGDRTHEGTDIMDGNNVSGEIPVVSMTDGYVKNIGWLTLGGYRIGIMSESGIYYYYAHLHSYAPGLEKGASVSAGQLLGFMGDTGYGDEGTTGQFPVHLHLGIYYYDGGGKEISINAYPFLKQVDVLKNVGK